MFRGPKPPSFRGVLILGGRGNKAGTSGWDAWHSRVLTVWAWGVIRAGEGVLETRDKGL